MIKRTTIGNIAKLIVDINNMYDDLQKEYENYSNYDGGQQPFNESEIYKYAMADIKFAEDNLDTLMNVRNTL